jgi:hypothetical protein
MSGWGLIARLLVTRAWELEWVLTILMVARLGSDLNCK